MRRVTRSALLDAACDVLLAPLGAAIAVATWALYEVRKEGTTTGGV